MRFGDAGTVGRDAGYTETVTLPVTDEDRPPGNSTWAFLPNWLLTHKKVYNSRGDFAGGTVGPDFMKLGGLALAGYFIGRSLLKK